MLFRSNDTATTEIYTLLYTLSLHDALPILGGDRLDAVLVEPDFLVPLASSLLHVSS